MRLKPDPRDYIYDIESYPNVFTFSAKYVLTGERFRFEISNRKNELRELLAFLYTLKARKLRMVGFNNNYYDYGVLHFIITQSAFGNVSACDIYQKSIQLLFAEDNEKFNLMVWDSDKYVEQIDLFKIHHFDNNARRTSLKVLEFNMRLSNIEDLPFKPGTCLTSDEIDILIVYNDWDVDATEGFYYQTLPMIRFREELSKRYDKSFINFSDKRIGSEILTTELEQQAPGSCYAYENGRKVKRQTFRSSINLNEVIFPYVKFNNPEFNRIKNWLASQTITETKGVFKDLTCKVDNCLYKFGTGGLHGGLEDACIITETDRRIIVDVDVASFYPNLGIKNKIYPEHLGEIFCNIYEGIFLERKKYPKKKYPALNAALKLALNGAYGDSNNLHSVFLDPKYTMSITVNGQLLLCMLAEFLMSINDLHIIQANTDGLTLICNREDLANVRQICKYWESITMLELEEAQYSRMFIRDVNSYIAEYKDGTLKRKGAYIHETPLVNPGTQEVLWHKDHSGLIIPKAAEAALVRGANIREFITSHNDVFDFMMRVKVPRSSRLVINYPEAWGDDTDFPLQNITRYFVSNEGGFMTKIMPPINKDAYIFIDNEGREHFAFNKQDCKPLEKAGHVFIGKQKRRTNERRISVEAGRRVTPCNNIVDFTKGTIDYEYYINEAEKLVKPLLRGSYNG